MTDLLQKCLTPNYFPRVSIFLLKSQVCEKSAYQQIFVAGFSELFATTWAEIAAENGDILHNPKLVEMWFHFYVMLLWGYNPKISCEKFESHVNCQAIGKVFYQQVIDVMIINILMAMIIIIGIGNMWVSQDFQSKLAIHTCVWILWATSAMHWICISLSWTQCRKTPHSCTVAVVKGPHLL